MQPTTPTAAASPPDPPKDPPAATLPANIEGLLQVGRILLTYGRHLVDTLRQRAAAPGFSAIAANFGTANVTTILAHLNRGILRCLALERVLLARAAAGRDIAFIERHSSITLLPEPDPADAPEPPRPAPAAQPLAAEPLPRRRHAPRASRPAFWDDPELHMPTLEELERQIRRQPMGRVFLAIALDLAVVPGLCHPGLWSALFDIMNWFGGGHAVDQLMREKSRRRQAFEKEQDRNPKASWDWLNIPRDALRNVLGFFIGEPPVNPLDPAAAIATAPP
jgi:hypothetical protein